MQKVTELPVMKRACLLARLPRNSVSMHQTSPAEAVGLEALVAHVQHYCPHLTRLTSLCPALDQGVAHGKRRLHPHGIVMLPQQHKLYS